MHYLPIEDDDGQLVDMLPTCSDACSRDLATRENLPYGEWYGAQETEFTTYCENCGVVLGGFDPECEHVYPVVVNLIGEPEDEHCEHGTLIRAAVRERIGQ